MSGIFSIIRNTYMRVYNFHGNPYGSILIVKTWQKGFLNERECRLLELRCNVHILQ